MTDQTVVALERESSPRADTILEAAAAAFSEMGFAATSMREIAARSGASLGSIYYHFSSKEEILRALMSLNFSRVLQSLQERTEGIDEPERQLEVFIDNHICFFVRHLSEMRVMSHELDTLTGDAGDEVARLRHDYADALLRILGRLRPDLDQEELRLRSLCLFGMLNWTYRWFHTVDPSISATGLARRMSALFLEGFREGS